MSGFFYYYDINSYVVMVLPAIILSVIAQLMVSSAYNKYSRVMNRSGMSGADTAMRILNAAGIYDVTVVPISGNLTDNYHPVRKVISLSEQVYYGTSIASVGIAAHEAGHAVQHSMGYGPLKLRNAIIPATKIGSSLAIPLVLVGFVLSLPPLVWLGIIFFAAAVAFQLITLPVEFNASHRALKYIESEQMLTAQESKGAKAMLRSAAMTYVAALLVSLMQMLRLIALASGRRR